MSLIYILNKRGPKIDNLSEVSCFKGLELVSIDLIAEPCASTEHSLNVRVMNRNAKSLILRHF